jgi:hypothetical protein
VRNIVEGLNLSFMFMGGAWETIKCVILNMRNMVGGLNISFMVMGGDWKTI